jgi:restriction system protein
MRAMSWEEFSSLLADAYRREGYSVAPGGGRGFDFTLTRDGRVTLLQCRRWKVNQVGAGPVRELADAVSREDASRGILVAAGQFSAPAQKATSTEPISLVSGVELVELVGRVRRKKPVVA